MGLSLAERYATELTPAEQKAWVHSLSPQMLKEIARGEWWWTSRPEQLPPEGDWSLCLVLAGRGYGKSRLSSEWLVQRVLDHPVDRHGFRTEWLLIAETLSDARTISIEGPSGVLRVLDRREIDYKYIKHPKPQIQIGDAKSVIFFEGADGADVGRGYNAAGAVLDEVCIAEGEPVATSRGLIPIESVIAGDEVWTRSGWRRVNHAWRTARNAELFMVETEFGFVRLTASHLVETARGWVKASELHLGDTVFSCLNQMSQFRQALQPSTNGMGRPGTTTNERATTTIETDSSCTEPCGSRSTDPSPMVSKSITSTETDGITDSSTWNCSPSQSIANVPIESDRIWKSSASGQAISAVEDSRKCGRTGSPDDSTAPSVGPPLSPPECEPSIAVPSAGLPGSRSMVPTLVTGVTKDSRRADVYDLEVEGQPEFFAGSGLILVHNCKWKRPKESWFEGIMPSLRADLVGDHPRTLVATTPKPIDLLREWVARDDGSVTLIRGSTFDNAANLSAYTLDELDRRYAGTAIGRQELYGELLDARDGMLFGFRSIDANRATLEHVNENVELTHLTVGVDPTLTEEGDLMGVVVVGRDTKNHMYVLGDESVPLTSRPAARHIWQVFHRYGADTIVVEENLAKRWMIDVLRDAYTEMRDQDQLFPAGTTPPIKRVDSRLGKKLRAEPVAMRYEQNSVHHVGTFSALEEEMLNFDPTDSHNSPNRMDALVHGCRHLMAGEKRRIRLVDPSVLWTPTR